MRKAQNGTWRSGVRRSAVTSISIFISGLLRPQTIMVAAGRCRRRSRRGSGRLVHKGGIGEVVMRPHDIGQRSRLRQRLARWSQTVAASAPRRFRHGHGGVVIAGGAGDEAPVALHDGARVAAVFSKGEPVEISLRISVHAPGLAQSAPRAAFAQGRLGFLKRRSTEPSP